MCRPGAPLPLLPEERWPRPDVELATAKPGLGLLAAVTAVGVAIVGVVATLLVVPARRRLPAADRDRRGRHADAEAAGAAGLSAHAAQPTPAPSRRRPALAPPPSGLVGHWRFDEPHGSPTARHPPGDRTASCGSSILPTRGRGAAVGAAGIAKGRVECPLPAQQATPRVPSRWRSGLKPRRERGNHRTILTRAQEGGSGELFVLGLFGAGVYLRGPWRARLAAPLPASKGWMHLAFNP